MKQDNALSPTADTVESGEIHLHTAYMQPRSVARPNGQVYKINKTKNERINKKDIGGGGGGGGGEVYDDDDDDGEGNDEI